MHPQAQVFFSVSLHDEPFLSYTPLFRKADLMIPNELDMFQGQKYQYACYEHPWGQNLYLLHSAVSRFLSYAPYSGKVHFFKLSLFFRKSAPNDPIWTYRVQGQKYQYACYMHPQGLKFHLFCSMMSRFWVMPYLSEKYTQWLHITLTCSRSKRLLCKLHIPSRAHIFVRSLYDAPFSSYGPILRKVNQITP